MARRVERRVELLIPAYRCADHIAATLDSALAQTAGEVLSLHVALDGRDKPSLTVLRPYEARGDIRLTVNETPLGWARNCQALIEACQSEFFEILFHDDALTPDAVERLLALLDARPDAVCAYGDVVRVKPSEAEQVRGMESIEGDRPARMLAAFAQRFPGTALRGLTRRRVCEDGFCLIRNAYEDFGADFSWTPLMARHGALLRVEAPLYRKLIRDEGVSGGWRGWPRNRLAAALGAFGAEVLRAMPDKPESEAGAIRAAAHAWLRQRATDWIRAGATREEADRFLIAVDAAIAADLSGAPLSPKALRGAFGEEALSPVIREMRAGLTRAGDRLKPDS